MKQQSPGKIKKDIGAKSSPGTRLLQTAMLQLGGNTGASSAIKRVNREGDKNRVQLGRTSLVAKALAVAVCVYVCIYVYAYM